MLTYIPKAADCAPKWYLVDAQGQVLGRVAARVASLLRGKQNPRFTPFLSTGEHVIVINASKVKITGRKLEDKQYHHFTGYPGGLKTKKMLPRFTVEPDEVLRDAIVGMLPKTTLGKHLARNLRVYGGEQHPHFGQTPEPVSLS